MLVFVLSTSAFADGLPVTEESEPPELNDIDRSSKKDGFVNLFGGYNPEGFSNFAVVTGLQSNFGLEYYSTAMASGGSDQAEPAYYRTKQNLYYETSKNLLDLSGQAVINSGTTPIYRLGMRWRVSSTPHIRTVFTKLGLTYAVNFQPVQVDSVPGYGWQIEHTYNFRFPKFLFFENVTLRGIVDQGNSGSGYTLSYTDQLLVPVVGALSVYGEQKYSPKPPANSYDGFSFGLEYSIPF